MSKSNSGGPGNSQPIEKIIHEAGAPTPGYEQHNLTTNLNGVPSS